jgi:hypothetical protein
VYGPGNQVGVFFIAPGSPDIAVKVTANLAVNEPSRIIGTGMRAPARQGLVY